MPKVDVKKSIYVTYKLRDKHGMRKMLWEQNWLGRLLWKAMHKDVRQNKLTGRWKLEIRRKVK